MLILILIACGVAEREACQAATAETAVAWGQVAGYYERMAAVEEPRMREAEAELRAAGEQREWAERRRVNTLHKRTTGLIDMRDGSERVDPEVAKELAPTQARARRDREAGADAEAEAVVALLEVTEHYNSLVEGASLARSIQQDFEGSLAQGLARLPEAAALSHTELTPIALDTSRRAQALCPAPR